jgi:hypothetical protein
MLMDAIVTSGTPDKVLNLAGNPYNGRAYSFILQDFIDGYAFGQIDSGCGRVVPERGSWNYNYSPGHPDNSSSQWAAIGMIPAEREWGLTIPVFTKTENDAAVRAMWNANGSIGYASTGCIWGCAATTPSGLVQWIMDGRAANNAEFAASLRWMADNWGAGPNEANDALILGYTYGLFAAVKSMRLSNPPVERLTRTNGTNFDWYNDPAIGVAHVVTSRQEAGGNWNTRGNNVSIPGLATQWHLLMLAGNLFAQAPKAVAGADPVRVAINQLVTFDHSQSFHLDPARRIVRFEWDFDGNGVFDLNTQNVNERPTFRYNPAVNEVPRVYTARLRVTDDQNPALTDTAEVQITVDSGNVNPVAVITPDAPSGPPNRDIALSGATSFDPNAGAPLNDRIVRYEWDLDQRLGVLVANGVVFAGGLVVALLVLVAAPQAAQLVEGEAAAADGQQPGEPAPPGGGQLPGVLDGLPQVGAGGLGQAEGVQRFPKIFKGFGPGRVVFEGGA